MFCHGKRVNDKFKKYLEAEEGDEQDSQVEYYAKRKFANRAPLADFSLLPVSHLATKRLPSGAVVSFPKAWGWGGGILLSGLSCSKAD